MARNLPGQAFSSAWPWEVCSFGRPAVQTAEAVINCFIRFRGNPIWTLLILSWSFVYTSCRIIASSFRTHGAQNYNWLTLQGSGLLLKRKHQRKSGWEFWSYCIWCCKSGCSILESTKTAIELVRNNRTSHTHNTINSSMSNATSYNMPLNGALSQRPRSPTLDLTLVKSPDLPLHLPVCMYRYGPLMLL